jgi:hypothetical protein
LLEKHDANTDNGSSPAPMSEAVEPRLNLEFKFIHARVSLQVRMPFCTNFVVESNFGTDLAPLLENTSIVGRKFAEFSKNMKSFIVATFAG